MSGRTFKVKQGRITDHVSLLEVIKKLRAEMISCGDGGKLTAPELLTLSRRLDRMINRFMRCYIVKPE